MITFGFPQLHGWGGGIAGQTGHCFGAGGGGGLKKKQEKVKILKISTVVCCVLSHAAVAPMSWVTV